MRKLLYPSLILCVITGALAASSVMADEYSPEQPVEDRAPAQEVAPSSPSSVEEYNNNYQQPTQEYSAPQSDTNTDQN
jgi:hypothetical protein